METAKIGSECASDDDAVESSVRPYLLKDDIWEDRCYICGVDGEVEEMEAEEDEAEMVVAKCDSTAGGEEVERVAAVKDERVVKNFGGPSKTYSKRD